jgi:hypothetical protein
MNPGDLLDVGVPTVTGDVLIISTALTDATVDQLRVAWDSRWFGGRGVENSSDGSPQTPAQARVCAREIRQ